MLGESPVVGWSADISKLETEIANLRSSIPTWSARMEELALAAETGHADAATEVEALDQQIAGVGRRIKQKEAAIAQLRKLITEHENQEKRRRDKHLRKKAASAVHDRMPTVKAIRKHAQGLAEQIAFLRKSNDPIFTSWQSSWPSKTEALLYPERVHAYVGQELYLAFKKAGIAPIEIKYTHSDFPGLVEAFRAADEWAQRVLLSDQPVTEPAPMPEPVEPQPADLPTSMPVSSEPALSGQAWQEILDSEAKRRPTQAANTDFDPFNI